jgi:arginine decarboxylase
VIKVKWTRDESRLVYGVGKEDLHFLDIDKQGNLCIILDNKQITLQDVIRLVGNEVRDRGYPRVPSFTLRIPQLIDLQIKKVSQIYRSVMAEHEYEGSYRVVYPLKVNPMKAVIHQVLNHDPNYGLEVGTKSELFIVLKELQDKKNRLIMCNGVKDAEYIEIVRQALEEDYHLWISVESPKEAQIALDMLPRDTMQLALRIKPYVSIISHWGASAGRHSKFGLAIEDLFQTLQLLQRAKAKDRVVAIHAHPGSQVLGNIYAFAEYVTHVYTYLHDSGFTNLNVINVGGGLPINYDGQLAPGTIHADATAIIVALIKILGSKYPHPDIMTESGRVITALYALLIVRAFELRRIFPKTNKQPTLQLLAEAKKAQDAHTILQVWQYWLKQATRYQDLLEIRDYERLTGYLKSQLRQLFVNLNNYEDYLGTPIAQDLLRPEYIIQGNFSVFNGACDHVLVGQYFPVLPITNLHTQPITLVRLVDITCDSDGEISNYTPPISDQQLFTQDGFPLTTTQKHTMDGFPIGDLSSVDDDYLAIALVGAYQDVIEMDHNLVGDLPDVELTLSPKRQWKIKWLGEAQTIQDLADDFGFSLSQMDDPYID